MRNLKSNKTAGTDGMHLELIKYKGNKILNRIYELVRQVWEDKRIPEEWKERIIVAIYNKGDRDGCENYREIALGNAAYKVVANIISEKLNHILKKLPGTIRMDSVREDL